MAHQENLFFEFPPLTKAEWLEKLSTELKGGKYEDLSWKIDETLDLPPVFGREDRSDPINVGKSANNWEIGEIIQVSDFSEANATALQALTKGVEALRFELNSPASKTLLVQLLQSIEAGYISLHLVLSENDSPVLAMRHLEEQLKKDSATLRGSVCPAPGSKGYSDDQMWSDMLKEGKKLLPNFRMKNVAVEDLKNPVHALTASLREAGRFLSGMSDAGLSPTYTASRIQFSVSCGKRYFLEIAKLRALRILWSNVLEAYGVTKTAVPIQAKTSLKAYGPDPNVNMIAATTIALSAVIGGADRLFVLPASLPEKAPTAFTRRIARNLQHIMKMESYLDRVADPAAGSYYIDQLTRELAERSWEKFCKG